MSGWSLYKIDNLIDEISMGPFGSDIKKEFYTSHGVPVLNGSNLQGFKLGEDSFGYVTEEKANSLKKCIAKRGDIVVTHRGTLGQMVYIPDDSKFDRYLISQSQFRYRLKKSLARPDFVVYYFHTLEGQYKLLSNASQVGVPALARATTTFRQLEIPLPPLSVQNKIVTILSSLDARIENNNKINANLEAQAQALFKSWFVDFEPFQDGEFEDSELGRIPKGWKVVKLGDLNLYITDYVSNGSFASLKQNVNLYEEVNYAYFIRNTDLKEHNFKVYVDKSSYDFLSKSKLYGGEIIISNVGDVGSVHICPKLNKPMTLGNNVIMIKSDERNLQTFIYAIFKSYIGKGYMDAIKGGSAVPKFNKTDFKNISIVLPPNKIIDSFGNIYNSIIDITSTNLQETKSLSTLRDTLLPKLMSGEIEV